jgi:hypothetical protein
MHHAKLGLVSALYIACLCSVYCGVGTSAEVIVGPRQEPEDKDVSELVRTVHKEWVARCDKLGPLDPKTALGRWGVELKSVIAQRVPKEEMRDFMLGVIAARPDAELVGVRRSMVVQGLVDIFSKDGHRAELVEMLSRDCPDRVYHSDIEFWLAYKARKTLPDGIEVLFDAFDRSKDPKVRQQIAGAIGRGFRANGLDFGRTKSTVDACRSWYSHNRDKIKPSVEYGDNVMHGPAYSDKDRQTGTYGANGLFVSINVPQPNRRR